MAAPSKKPGKRSSGDHGLKPRSVPMKSKKPNSHARASDAETIHLQIDDEDADFPRGGGSSLSREEEAEVRAKAEVEFEMEQRQGKKKSKRATKSSMDGEDDMGSMLSGGITGKLPRYANRITVKNISEGMKLWGVVVEVNQKDLVVGLPGGLRGFVRAEDASDCFSGTRFKRSECKLLSSIFHVGQLVPCIVLQVVDEKRENKGGKRIWLSLRLSLLYKGFTLDVMQNGMVLAAYVKSVEDHGYILDFGLPSFSGFFPRKKGNDNSEVAIHTGGMVQGIVSSIDKVRGVISMSCDPDLVTTSLVKDLKGLSIDVLLPGMMVNAFVQSTLVNGIMMSFLTYFTGTVDIFHLQDSLPNRNWRAEYSQNKKVAARVLFIDPSTRAIGLTMNPHLLCNKAPPLVVKSGDIFDTSRVLRVDRGLGILLELPSEPVPTPCFVGISDIVDSEFHKLEKKFKEGSHVRSRVLGFKHLEGLAVGTLKQSAFEGPVFTHADVKPGMRVKGKVISVDDKGALVQLASSVKALCPVSHMSEYAYPRRSAKFKVGAQLLFRVLGCKSKRITVTYKKSLVRSNLEILASYADVAEGFITHGWIEKIENFGCFVRFYNGVKGFTHRTELGLDSVSEAQSIFHEGEVVKCRVIGASPASRKINLSFVLSPKRISEDNIPKVGSLISGVVVRLESLGVVVKLQSKIGIKGTVFNEHLADFQGQADKFKSLLKLGYEFDKLLVLDCVRGSLVLSAKYSLINSAEQLPQEIVQVHPHSVVHGYICNSIETGCFVRYLGNLTGFAPRNKATDEQSISIPNAFYIGQSVRSHVLEVDTEKARLKLSLKQSCCFSTDASYICSYFQLEEKISELQVSDNVAHNPKWEEKFYIESLVEVKILEKKEFGVLVGLSDHCNIFGFITSFHLGETKIETGSVCQALVLDVSRADNLVDLSLKPKFVNSKTDKEKGHMQSIKKKRKREAISELKLHDTVNAVVELVKNNYLVLSLPDHGQTIGFACIYDYNTQKLPQKSYSIGERVLASIEILPGPSTGGRLLLLLKSLSEMGNSSNLKRAKKKSSCHVGSLVQAEITDIGPLELQVKFGVGLRGRIHITEVSEGNSLPEKPLSNFKIGQLLNARIVAYDQDLGKSKSGSLWDLSVKPSILSDDNADGILLDKFDFTVGDTVCGYVVKVDSEWVWLVVSRKVRAQIFILDSSREPCELKEFQNRFTRGQVICGSIIGISDEKKLLRLSLCSLNMLRETCTDDDAIPVVGSKAAISSCNNTYHIFQDDIIGGRISKIQPGVRGLVVQIGPHLYGRVHFTDIADVGVADPLSGYKEGQFVKCLVLQVGRSFKDTAHMDLSLRFSSLGTSRAIPVVSDKMPSCHNPYENLEELHPNMEIQGYVKSVTPKGCFVMLSRKVDAKILLSNLSDKYVENPELEFPVGKLIKGRILSVEPLSGRVEVTLKTRTVGKDPKAQLSDIRKLRAGNFISGAIRRVESYGLFITIDQTSVVGLCHISELSDTHIDKIADKYKAGERVVAKILKVDEERLRVSLGMKNSYVQNDCGASGIVVNENVEYNKVAASVEYNNHIKGNLGSANDRFPESTTDSFHVFEQAEARASIPPLDVSLNDFEASDVENADTTERIVIANGNVEDSVKKRKRQKRKEKEEREMEIRAAEKRLLQSDIPRTGDEFEKLVRGSPNSSFAWIQYMAYCIDMAEIEKARSVAERALRTINLREEAEKLNIWVAYFNLENKFGNPPEEAIMKLLEKAVQCCDPKKVHLALLDMYVKSDQQQLGNELLDKMTKKFKKSCKVWLRRAQSHLLQGQELQSVVNRALLSLPHKKHIKFISHSAILEFRHGVPERGRSMFEGILREFPKRTDLWSVYLDQEIRLGETEVIHALFEKAISLTLPPRKMKFIFKKYLEYEKSCGDEDRVEYVKKRAMEYVESG